MKRIETFAVHSRHNYLFAKTHDWAVTILLLSLSCVSCETATGKKDYVQREKNVNGPNNRQYMYFHSQFDIYYVIARLIIIIEHWFSIFCHAFFLFLSVFCSAIIKKSVKIRGTYA